MFRVIKGQGQCQNAHACLLPILKACISMPDQYPHPFEYAVWEGQLHGLCPLRLVYLELEISINEFIHLYMKPYLLPHCLRVNILLQFLVWMLQCS